MNKKNLILTIIIAVLSVAGLTLGIISICGGFSVNESDYRVYKEEKYAKEISVLISEVIFWPSTSINYHQIYRDGQIVERRTEETGQGIDGYRMFQRLSVTGTGAYDEKCAYNERKLIRVVSINGEEKKTEEEVTSVNRFAEIKKEFSGDYRKYLNAFTPEIFTEIYIMRQGNVVYYKVVFDDEKTVSIMGTNTGRLQLLVVAENGKTTLLRFMYDKKANPKLSDDEDSSAILEFSPTVDISSWENLG